METIINIQDTASFLAVSFLICIWVFGPSDKMKTWCVFVVGYGLALSLFAIVITTLARIWG